MDIDKLNNQRPEVAADVAFNVIKAVQRERPHTQVLSILCAAVLLAENTKLPLQDLLTVTYNIMWDSERHARRTHFDAISAYIQGELDD